MKPSRLKQIFMDEQNSNHQENQRGGTGGELNQVQINEDEVGKYLDLNILVSKRNMQTVFTGSQMQQNVLQSGQNLKTNKKRKQINDRYQSLSKDSDESVKSRDFNYRYCKKKSKKQRKLQKNCYQQICGYIKRELINVSKKKNQIKNRIDKFYIKNNQRTIKGLIVDQAFKQQLKLFFNKNHQENGWMNTKNKEQQSFNLTKMNLLLHQAKQKMSNYL